MKSVHQSGVTAEAMVVKVIAVDSIREILEISASIASVWLIAQPL